MRFIHAVRTVGIVLAMLALAGFIMDLVEGLPFTRSLPGWSIWFGGVLVAGLIYTAGEMGFDRITASDTTTNSLPTRVVRLFLGLSFVAGLVIAVLLLVRALMR